MKKPIDIDKLHEMAIAAMREAVDEVIEDHARRGALLAVWRDDKVAYITAEEARRERNRIRNARTTK